MEDSTRGYVMSERCLLGALSQHFAWFACVSAFLLKDHEPPGKSLNLSPKPIPKCRSAETLITRLAERVM
jgi:hypothetical protein